MHASDAAPQGMKIASPRRLKIEAEQLRLHQPQLRQLAALDLAAQARGSASYKAYLRAWHRQNAADQGHAVKLSARWFDRTTNTRGGMHAIAVLTEPWPNFLSLAERRRIGVLGDFHILRGNRSHLIAPEAYPSWDSCIHKLSKAIRRLIFVDTMRVLPASTKRAVQAFRGDPHGMLSTGFPNCDHESIWFDPKTGLHFILNEPYHVNDERQQPVLATRDMVAFTTREWTIHNPAGTLAQLIGPTQDAAMLAEMFSRSKALPGRFEKITFTDDNGQQSPIFE